MPKGDYAIAAHRTPEPGLRTGLISLAVVTAAFIALFLSGVFRADPKLTPADGPVTVTVEAILSDSATAMYMRRFEQHAPIDAQMLRYEAQAAIKGGAGKAAIADLILRATLAQFQKSALDLRRASTDDFDAILAHLRVGFAAMARSDSHWCEASSVETLLKRSQTDLIAVLLAEFEYDSEAYRWALEWGGLYLQATDRARRTPVPHGRRTLRDKTVLQQQGLALGTKEWALALQIATFSQAEGQGYAQMREVIESIDVCKLAVTAVDLSDELPEANRGRIWAELMPEIFYGNTPYVLALVTDYFFLS